MVYNERYNIGWSSKTNKGYVYIDQVDGSSASEPLILARDGITINTNFSDWNDPIIGQTAQINIMNNKENIFDLLPLLSGEEREYRIRINRTSPTPKKLFEGFLNSDIVEQTYLSSQPIRLVASNYIGKLEYVTPPSIETIQKKSLIDIINETLKLTGKDSSIRVNMNICPSGGSISTNKTALNLCALDTEIFWQNNIERDNGFDILNKVLKPFDSYLYWWDGNWYIERYEDLYKYPQHYVTYRPDISYGYSCTATNVSTGDVSVNIFSVPHIDRSQLLSIIPGLNKIEIKLNDELYNSVIKSDLTGMTVISAGWPLERTWRYSLGKYPDTDDDIVWNTTDFGKSNGTITNACNLQIPNSWLNKRFGVDIENYKFESRILTTTFKVTVDPSTAVNKTDLTIKFKWRPGGQTAYEWDILKDPYVVDYRIKWYLYRPDSAFQFVCKDPSDHWYIKTGATEDEAYQTTIIEKTEFDIDKNYTAEVTLTIPLSDVSGGFAGDQKLTFAIFLPSYTYNHTVFGWSGELMTQKNVLGDFIATVPDSIQDNLIIGETNSKFLNKKTIELDLFDISNLNYKNGIYTGTTLTDRTSYWYDDASLYLPLTDRLIKNKFQLYNRSRQSISSTIISTDFLKPFSMWYDSNQAGKKYVLTSYSYVPTRNEYSAVWNEYDNETIVNLNNV